MVDVSGYAAGKQMLAIRLVNMASGNIVEQPGDRRDGEMLKIRKVRLQ